MPQLKTREVGLHIVTSLVAGATRNNIPISGTSEGFFFLIITQKGHGASHSVLLIVAGGFLPYKVR